MGAEVTPTISAGDTSLVFTLDSDSDLDEQEEQVTEEQNQARRTMQKACVAVDAATGELEQTMNWQTRLEERAMAAVAAAQEKESRIEQANVAHAVADVEARDAAERVAEAQALLDRQETKVKEAAARLRDWKRSSPEPPRPLSSPFAVSASPIRATAATEHAWGKTTMKDLRYARAITEQLWDDLEPRWRSAHTPSGARGYTKL